MDPATPAPGGFIGSLLALGDGLLEGLQARLELLAADLQEQKLRLIQTFLWIVAAVFAAAMALVFASLMVVVWFWDTARVAALGGVTLFYAGTFVVLVVAFRRVRARRPRPFAATLDEIGLDRAHFRPKESAGPKERS
jgi:uncharacterized membrane protein YqjE